MRTRSPRTAPPVNGLVGSTAMMPTAFPSLRFRRQPIDERALAGTGRAGHADELGAPRLREDCLHQLGAGGAVVFDERDRPSDRPRIACDYARRKGVGVIFRGTATRAAASTLPCEQRHAETRTRTKPPGWCFTYSTGQPNAPCFLKSRSTTPPSSGCSRRPCTAATSHFLRYCVMPNHWPLCLPRKRTARLGFMHWLTTTHARRWQDLTA